MDKRNKIKLCGIISLTITSIFILYIEISIYTKPHFQEIMGSDRYIIMMIIAIGCIPAYLIFYWGLRKQLKKLD